SERKRLFAHALESCICPGAGDHVALAEIERHRNDAMSGVDVLLKENGVVENDRVHWLICMSLKRCMIMARLSGLSMMTKTVSSPPMVPRISGHSAESIAEASIIALPGGVRRTMSLTLPLMLVTSSATKRCRRLA